MAKITADQIRKLKESTGAPVMRVKKVLEEFGGDMKKSEDLLKKEGFEKAAKRAERETSQGVTETYMHHSGKIATIAEVFCETDFVARNEVFKDLSHNIALQAASMGEKDILNQDFIKDPSKKINDLVKEAILKTGENIRVGRVVRIVLGDK